MFKKRSDLIASIRARDPAARSNLEVVFSYPGFHALMFYRCASWFWRRRMRFLGRWFSQWGRFWTGIEIHPGADIGRRLFIDHGMGVVIGETAEIGDDVTLYHGVTLGGVAPSVDSDSQRQVKRHPTLEDGVIVGSGAQILGPITVGAGARVGANAVVVGDVLPGMTVTGIPARAIMPKDKQKQREFMAYGTPSDLPDPLVPALDTMRSQIKLLADKVDALESDREDARADDTSDDEKSRSAESA
jgi:serine O-acetyltransferase